jgi:hypothetical protein
MKQNFPLLFKVIIVFLLSIHGLRRLFAILLFMNTGYERWLGNQTVRIWAVLLLSLAVSFAWLSDAFRFGKSCEKIVGSPSAGDSSPVFVVTDSVINLPRPIQ